MRLGERVRQSLSQHVLGSQVGVSSTDISKVENEKLDFGDYASEALSRKQAIALEARLHELFVPAQVVPNRIREPVLARPDAFLKLTELDDRQLDRLMGNVPKLKEQ